jgi:hypothetical protein
LVSITFKLQNFTFYQFYFLEFLNDQRTGSNKYDQLDNIFDHIINKTNEIREKAQSAERDETGL